MVVYSCNSLVANKKASAFDQEKGLKTIVNIAKNQDEPEVKEELTNTRLSVLRTQQSKHFSTKEFLRYNEHTDEIEFSLSTSKEGALEHRRLNFDDETLSCLH